MKLFIQSFILFSLIIIAIEKLTAATPSPPKLVTWKIPEKFNLDIRNFADGKKITHFTCDKKMIPHLEKALRCVAKKQIDIWYLEEDQLIKNSAGCYANRKIAGTNVWSRHSRGMAIDINVPRGANRRINLQPKQVVECFLEAGFRWGGHWKSPDFMHFEL